jgi:hypothetical protein
VVGEEEEGERGLRVEWCGGGKCSLGLMFTIPPPPL